MRDPRYWGDYGRLNQFLPERFLPEFNPQADQLPDVLSLAFGFGRRYGCASSMRIVLILL